VWKNIIFCLALLFSLSTAASATDTPDIRSLKWNKYNTKNFEILGIDNSQAVYLNANLENMKSWILVRWGLPDVQFNIPCRIICVPNKELYQAFFAKETQCYRVVRDKNGSIVEMAIWLNLDSSHWTTGDVPRALTEVCLQQAEAQTGKLGLWAHRGTALLNGDLGTIRSYLGALNQAFIQDTPIFWSKEILLMDESKLANNSAKAWYDAEATAFCLMLYKEFGPIKFRQFLLESQKDPEAALKSIYGFKDYEDFNSSFKRFMFALSSDIVGKGQQLTPNSYLTWPLISYDTKPNTLE